VIPIASQAVDTGPDQEMRSDLLCRAEKLIDVALAITDMNASPRIIQKLRGLLQILQPSDALLFLDGTRVGLTFFLSATVPLNFFRVQHLTADNPSGSPSIVTASSNVSECRTPCATSGGLPCRVR